MERSTIPPGGGTRLVVLQPGPLRLRWLRVRLTGREETPQKEGSPRVSVLHDEAVTEVGRTSVGRDVPLELSAELRIPADAKPSASGPPTVRWRVEVWGLPRIWPRFTLSFPIMVAPDSSGPHAEEAGSGEA